VAVTITLVRHAETAGNVAGRWHGHTDSELTPNGVEQAARLARRLANRHFDLVVSSDLGRTQATAAALGRDFEVDARWREPDVGNWENLTSDEVGARWPRELGAVLAGEDIRLGGAERLSETVARQIEAYEEVVERVGDGSALVVGHGLALLALVSVLIGTRLPSPLGLMGNTAITTIVTDGPRRRVPLYNDVTHTSDGRYSRAPSDVEVLLIRHGRTDANDEGRWQGQTDGALTDEGRRQARLLAAGLPELDAVYTSPLARARETAEILVEERDLSPSVDDDLKEIGFGSWEGRTRDEIAAADPDGMARLVAGEDIVRGGTGETFAAVSTRMRSATERIAVAHPGGSVGIVSHGGATRAYAADVLGIEFALRGRLTLLANTGYARLAISERGTSVLSWNLTPHLEK